MNKVITINLNGVAYQVDEAGYESLRAYLDRAAAALEHNPDRTEILSDLEQAIADKCSARLNARQSVITAREIERIIEEMGAVDDEPASATNEPSAAADEKPRAAKRFYRIKEGAVIAGVCNGLAAYFNVDVSLVRIGFVVLTLLSGGTGVVLYLVITVLTPNAETAAEQAAAFGAPSLTAQEVIDRARKGFERFKNRRERRAWRRKARAQARQWKYEWHRQHFSGRVPLERPPLWNLIKTAEALLELGVIVFLLWFGYHHVPVIHEFFDSIANAWTNMTDALVRG